MKTKILVCYSTNRDEQATRRFNKEIKNTIGCKCDIVPVHNTGSKSLTQVYNNIWQTHPYDESFIFVFCHHDIHFKTNGWGKALLNLFNGNNETHIVGVAGTEHLFEHGIWWLDENGQTNQTDLWGKVWHTDGKKKWKSDFTGFDKKCAKLQPVSTVDGVLIAFDPDACEEFDDENFKGFHFYDTSFCIRNLKAGKNIFVTESIQILHESEGPLSEDWDNNRKKFCEIYGGSYTPNINLLNITQPQI